MSAASQGRRREHQVGALPIPRGNSPLCACGCGHRTSTIRTEYILGHRPRRDPAKRFWAKVKRPAQAISCWEWKGSLMKNGYATFRPEWDGRAIMAHRYAYELAYGPIPDGLTVDHLCRNRACVNPGHMELVTRGENARRGGGLVASAAARKARADKACPNGHPRTPEHAYREGGEDGPWRCRTCRNAKRRKRP